MILLLSLLLRQDAVGWRPEAKRLLLLMTDQPSHLALDSRLAGIVVPHDGRCHLENNVYTASTSMVSSWTSADNDAGIGQYRTQNNHHDREKVPP